MDKEKFETIVQSHHIPAYRYFETIGSTNDEAIKWVLEGASEYALVLADTQTAGRGRQGRKWTSHPGASIAISIILHPTRDEQERLGLISLMAGLATMQAISRSCSGNIQVKWPNDVLIDRKKAAGVLVEAVWHAEQLQGLVIGIGINVLGNAVPSAETLLYPATCMQDHSGKKPHRLDVLDQLLMNLPVMRAATQSDEFPAIYMEKMAFVGEKISIISAPGISVDGLLQGIDQNGNLFLKTQDGQLQTFLVGDVSLRPA